MAKENMNRHDYFVEKCNEAYEVEQVLTAIRLGLSASGICKQDYELLLQNAIQKIRMIISAFRQEADRDRKTI